VGRRGGYGANSLRSEAFTRRAHVAHGVGLTLAFGDTSGGFRRLIQIIFGLSIAFAASSFFLTYFSLGGKALV
jgi:hypothetical protein